MAGKNNETARKDDKNQRLSAALRANLKRRKAQARAQQENEPGKAENKPS